MGWTLLHWAAFYNSKECLEVLLSHQTKIRPNNEVINNIKVNISTVFEMIIVTNECYDYYVSMEGQFFMWLLGRIVKNVQNYYYPMELKLAQRTL